MFCCSLKSVTIINGVNPIGYSAFYGCTSLKTVNGNMHYLLWNSFFGTAIESIVVGNGNEEDQSVFIDENAFENCEKLKYVTIKTRFKYHSNDTSIKSCSIQKYAFHNCPSIESFTIDRYVDEIKEYAFSFNEVNNVTFQYYSLSSPQICSSLDPNNKTMLLPIFSSNSKIIKVKKEYESDIFCPCDRLGCPTSYIENNSYDKIQNASVLIEKKLGELAVESSSSEPNGSSLNESSFSDESSWNEVEIVSNDESSGNESEESSLDENSGNELNESSNVNEESGVTMKAFLMAFFLILMII